MSRSWLLYLDDLIASAEKIGRLIRGQTLTTFTANEAVFDAVLFNLQVIGEAAKNLPEEARLAILPQPSKQVAWLHGLKSRALCSDAMATRRWSVGTTEAF